METTLTLIGNAINDPEIRYTASGIAVAGFTIASTPRLYDKTTGRWRDGDTTFLRVNAWRALADNAAASIRKGTRVVVLGRIRQSTWTADNGTEHQSIEVDADEIGLSLRWTTAHTTAATRPTGDSSDDPWATSPDASPDSSAGPGAPF
jgi:single-strand DNA-binding protein